MKKILLVGKPNCGKSLLFNQLTGLRQKVANYPGVTVEIKSGRMAEYEIIDFPGTYSLNTLSIDEKVAVEQLTSRVKDEETELVVCVLDATRLERSLVFALQAQQLAIKENKQIVFVLNFIDEVKRFGHNIDLDGLSRELGAPVYALSARSLDGIAEFKDALLTAEYKNFPVQAPRAPLETTKQFVDFSRSLAKTYAMNKDVVLRNQNRVDTFLLNSFLGGFAFLAIMFVLFQSIFTWATPLMDGVETIIASFAGFVTQFTGEGVVTDFLNDAIFGGVGSFLVFVPQIMVLTFVIGLLEDSGYLARAALICHKPLSYFGLSGRSFIPYLSGHACAIPAIMAARTIESPRKRLITMLTIPLMSCSARLPVYALLVSVFIPSDQYFLGFFNMQGLTFFGLYMFGIVTALIISALLSHSKSTEQEQSEMPFIIELPSYRLPHWKPLYHRVINSGQQFIKRAAPVIFMVAVGIWVLGYFPLNASLEESWLGSIGHFIEPVFAPLGLDWRYGIAILMSFLAREVFVGALGTLYGMEGADENIAGLAQNIMNDGLPLGTGIGLLLFYVVALQCVATVATLKAETGNAKLSWGLYAAYGILAYILAFLANTFI
ncbi:ferrous iron transporter B [Psychrosphaera saromensis]|uniref:Ferrous iron transport protein B n=1 Tax=Psychrosphaera saromensis TaxID=716813 RepID=A0A2S7URW5_9GAMM|nr:ferrous iron transporter B [Psychrosphaera saromensis]PQJ52726.1 ferrous iron transporter B [Psychrosphaera saromensis]GHB70750.1 ferrous iron transporter B [Psychrosphaera saromensis]GLQ13212.1 ferrous iron transporter B [Psychrosphaera saromensis]